MSYLFKREIRTFSDRTVPVIITAQRMGCDGSGNPKYHIQVWTDRREHSGGNLWHPKVKGFRSTKNDAYIMTSHGIEQDIEYFVEAFETAILQ